MPDNSYILVFEDGPDSKSGPFPIGFVREF